MTKNPEPEPITQYRFGTGEPYVTKAEHAAALAAKDAALRECVEAMAKARACFHQGTADDILDEAIAKHRPKEGADNAHK